MSFCCILIIYWFISYYVVLILYNYINVMYWLFSCSVFSLCLYIYNIICNHITIKLFQPCVIGFKQLSNLFQPFAIFFQKGLLPALKSPIVCIHSLFVVDILHDLIFFVVHAQAFSIRNTDRLVVGAQKAMCFPKYITLSKTILAFCCPYTSLF